MCWRFKGSPSNQWLAPGPAPAELLLAMSWLAHRPPFGHAQVSTPPPHPHGTTSHCQGTKQYLCRPAGLRQEVQQEARCVSGGGRGVGARGAL